MVQTPMQRKTASATRPMRSRRQGSNDPPTTRSSPSIIGSRNMPSPPDLKPPPPQRLQGLAAGARDALRLALRPPFMLAALAFALLPISRALRLVWTLMMLPLVLVANLSVSLVACAKCYDCYLAAMHCFCHYLQICNSAIVRNVSISQPQIPYQASLTPIGADQVPRHRVPLRSDGRDNAARHVGGSESDAGPQRPPQRGGGRRTQLCTG
jgi:hypothetical protein